MKVRLFGILLIFVGLLGATVSSAQDLPLLPQHPAVKNAVFSNGLSCYLAKNESSKSIADFSLLKRDYNGNELVCAYRNVVVSSETAVDSLLLNLMRRVEADKTPADCAVVICGDIDVSSVMTKLKYMSLMVNSSIPSPLPEYVWDGNAKALCSVSADTLKGLATVHFEWQAPREAQEKANTIQSAVYEKVVWELGEVVKTLVGRSLRKQDVPVADISYSRVDCTSGLVHDGFVVDVVVPQAYSAQTELTVASVLAFLDRGEVHMNDLLLAECDYFLSLGRSASKSIIRNDEYTRLCRDAFLYNTPLSSDMERLSFFKSKDISELTRRKMFSSVSSALIDVDVPSPEVEIPASGVLCSDTLGLPVPNVKMKVQSSRKDLFSGGTVWTFANGFKVIYKKMPTDRRLYYSMSLNGGYGNIDQLERGEGAYMSDYLDHSWIAGLKGGGFKDVLKLSGMTMDVKVGLLNTSVWGHVDDRNAGLLLKALLAVANESRLDTVSVNYYSRCENIRRPMLAESDIRERLDGLLCPEYKYSPFKTSQGVKKETFLKAEALFSALTSKMNDGVLVIVGDMDEGDLKKLLQVYVGGFKVRNVASRRPSIQYHPVSGWSSYSVEGEKDAAYVVITTPLSMTAANHFATEIAQVLFEYRVKKLSEEKGFDAEVFCARGIYPDERFSIMVEISGECNHLDIGQLREILSDCQSDIPVRELDACKAYLKNSYGLRMQSPEYWLKVIPLRYLEGKDFTTGYDAKIDAVTVEMLQHVFKALDNGAGIEYVITKK